MNGDTYDRGGFLQPGLRPVINNTETPELVEAPDDRVCDAPGPVDDDDDGEVTGDGREGQ